MSKKTFTYFALVIENKHLGVAQKIKNTVLKSRAAIVMSIVLTTIKKVIQRLQN